MINYALGIMTGLLLSLVVISLLTFFRRIIEHKITMIEKYVDQVSPSPKGFIVEPDSEADVLRAQIIEENRKLGKDTPIQDLL